MCPATPTDAAAVSAAQRVYSVRVVADDIEVKLSDSSKRDDADIADDITRHMRVSTEIPQTVNIEVLKGHVTLRGEVAFSYQRRDAERAIQHLAGVHGISNRTTIQPDQPQIADVQHRVHEAIARLADLDARSIRIISTDGTIHLHGSVRSFAEKRAAELSAAAAPGVRYVDNEILVSP